MNAKASFQVIGGAGSVPLGRELGKGGEGSVFEVSNRPDLVAKIYHKPMSAGKASKIEAMAAMKSDRLLSLTAWPIELLQRNGSPCGFLMQRIIDHKDIHNLYSPRSRKTEFPNADWRFLIAAAANTARAFALIHDAGCIIGDINHGGITVSGKATVKLIDCDSFQVSARGQRFLCEVGTPTFTPPELQGKPFKGVVRTPNHDNFGLAVMIFHLLFLGRHPFAGRFLGRGDMGIEQAISEYRFAYGANRTAVSMEPPPNVPDIAAASQSAALLLERAFSREGVNGSRPTAIEWISVLGDLHKQTKPCHVNASHYYFNGLPTCPWCHIEAATGVVLFHIYVHRTGSGATAFDLASVWSQITSVQSPGLAPTLLDRQQLGVVKPSAQAVEAGGNQTLRTLGMLVVVVSVIILCAAAPAALLFWVCGGFFVGKIVGTKRTDSTVIADFTAKYRTADAQHRAIRERWDRDATDAKFKAKLRELENYKQQWQEIPGLRQRRYRELEKAQEEAQFKRFLEQFLIDSAVISGVAAGRKAMLASYNVETAWDISDRNISRVPGFGPALTIKLKEWRRSVERKFRFDPSKGVDPRDIAALDREMADLRNKIERHLVAGAADLTQITNQIITLRRGLKQQVNNALQTLLQAEADMKAATA
jgi:DNA-binding helix-hairpin-helix protein with protein kinase domain